MKKMKLILLVVAMLAAMVAGAAPAFAEQQGAAEEIAVTGVVKDGPDKADGTPAYSITDESSIPGPTQPFGKGYILEGDYSAYVGQRITVYGIPHQDHEMRILDVTRIG